MKLKSFFVASTVAFAVASTAVAEDLTIGVGASITSIDPHFYNASPNNNIAMQIFDRLTERSATGALEPGLAESWEATGEEEWTFKLREGVTWHDGEPFTSDDVIFSLSRAGDVPNSPGGFGGFIRSIESASAPDDTTVVIKTKGPAPNLPGNLANIAIISRHVGERAETADYNDGSAAIGTGALKFESFNNGDSVVLSRNDDWWGHELAWETVTYRMLTSNGGRTAAMLAQDVDMIDTPPAVDLPRLDQAEGLHVSSTAGLRAIYLMPNYRPLDEVLGISGKGGATLTENPLTNVNVRKALAEAINREAIVERIMEGTATASAQWLPSSAYSYAPSKSVEAPDLEEAKALLAEGGYEDGFSLTLFAPTDRYPNAPAVAQAVAQMWTRIGVETSVEALPWANYSSRRNEFGIHLIGLGNSTFDASSMLVNVLGSVDPENGMGASNQSGYGNPALDEMTLEALRISDDAAREAKLIEAVEMAMDDQAIIPLYQQSNAWALRDGLTYAPRIDERTVAKDVMKE
ncbi:ABC transporter substrate-binding protein [Ponticoccus alexandrii]|uniref:ABC transporter substrate-binding protein n=1 Tax=Ponticoccus alexandrii TaxID=1943633 RepID=A0ABX7FFY9_9RHOB|nr:ABC transporter substrate-binding protein [Ponticoccus alexandrii]QRF68663.1 ABC transporter substrate-binding protein [Ponticoccus alexandrii]